MTIVVFTQETTPLWEAAAFTLGCTMLQKSRFNRDRVGVILFLAATVLMLMLLVKLTPEIVDNDPSMLDPAFTCLRRT